MFKLLIIFLGITSSIFSQNLDQNFDNPINNNHPAGVVLSTAQNNEVAEYLNNYTILKSRNFSPGFLDADILTLLLDSVPFNEIKSVLLSYLRVNYQYPITQASIIADYILYYNALYFNKRSYFESKYNPSVLSAIKSSSIGFSNRESNKGTGIIIPIDDISGQVNISEIFNMPVQRFTENIITQDNKNNMRNIELNQVRKDLNIVNQDIDNGYDKGNILSQRKTLLEQDIFRIERLEEQAELKDLMEEQAEANNVARDIAYTKQNLRALKASLKANSNNLKKSIKSSNYDNDMFLDMEMEDSNIVQKSMPQSYFLKEQVNKPSDKQKNIMSKQIETQTEEDKNKIVENKEANKNEEVKTTPPATKKAPSVSAKTKKVKKPQSQTRKTRKSPNQTRKVKRVD